MIDKFSGQAHGSSIKKIMFPDQSVLECSAFGDLQLSVTHHGDRDEIWVVRVKDNNEVERWNIRFIEGIIWAGKGDG